MIFLYFLPEPRSEPGPNLVLEALRVQVCQAAEQKLEVQVRVQPKTGPNWNRGQCMNNEACCAIVLINPPINSLDK